MAVGAVDAVHRAPDEAAVDPAGQVGASPPGVEMDPGAVAAVDLDAII